MCLLLLGLPIQAATSPRPLDTWTKRERGILAAAQEPGLRELTQPPALGEHDGPWPVSHGLGTLTFSPACMQGLLGLEPWAQ